MSWELRGPAQPPYVAEPMCFSYFPLMAGSREAAPTCHNHCNLQWLRQWPHETLVNYKGFVRSLSKPLSITLVMVGRHGLAGADHQCNGGKTQGFSNIWRLLRIPELPRTKKLPKPKPQRGVDALPKTIQNLILFILLMPRPPKNIPKLSFSYF